MACLAAMDQGLLVRNPTLTEQEFSDHWFNKHAQIVVPFFLHSGIQDYEQIHGPLTPITKDAAITSLPDQTPLNLLSYSGAVGFPPQSALEAMYLPKWKQAYYDEVIKVDERRFLKGEALECIVRVAPMSVKGERKVVIEGGEVKITVEERVWRVWREYEARGEVEQAKEGEVVEEHVGGKNQGGF